MTKKLLCLFSLFASLACFANEDTSIENSQTAETPQVEIKEKFLNCSLKAKAVQAGSFWGGTYFDTSVTSERIKALQIKVEVNELKKGKKHSASAKIKLEDKSILVAKPNDPKGVELAYDLTFERKSRSVSSTADVEIVLPLKTNIRYGDNNYEKQFTMFPVNKAYVHFDIDEPSQFDFKVTNIFMICSITE